MELEMVASIKKIQLKSKWGITEVEIEYENIPITCGICDKDEHNDQNYKLVVCSFYKGNHRIEFCQNSYMHYVKQGHSSVIYRHRKDQDWFQIVQNNILKWGIRWGKLLRLGELGKLKINSTKKMEANTTKPKSSKPTKME